MVVFGRKDQGWTDHGADRDLKDALRAFSRNDHDCSNKQNCGRLQGVESQMQGFGLRGLDLGLSVAIARLQNGPLVAVTGAAGQQHVFKPPPG